MFPDIANATEEQNHPWLRITALRGWWNGSSGRVCLASVKPGVPPPAPPKNKTKKKRRKEKRKNHCLLWA
jgi:hypothetical protein